MAPIQVTPWTHTKVASTTTTTTSTELKDFPHAYAKRSFLRPGNKEPPPLEDAEDWAFTYDAIVVGCISLYYATQDDVTMDDDEDMQQTVLTKAVVEYQSQPSKGSLQARKQEEPSLTGFGNGSVHGNVKLRGLEQSV
jgi:hypothetical protein